MPREEYCYSCGSEVERYEFTECKACHEYFCEDCVNEEELCDQCYESRPNKEGVSQKCNVQRSPLNIEPCTLHGY